MNLMYHILEDRVYDFEPSESKEVKVGAKEYTMISNAGTLNRYE